MGRIAHFEDITAWQKARQLTQLIYRVTKSGGFARDFSLRDQIRRASVSVLSNIAEGFERRGDKEFLQFLSLAKGSCGEVRAQLYVAYDESYLTKTQFDELLGLATEISRMIAGLMKYLSRPEKTRLT